MPIDFSKARAAIRDEHFALRFSDTLEEPCRLRWVPAVAGKRGFSTASWCWLAKEMPPCHLITIGEGLADRCAKPERLSEYALAYYHHELQHALSTERDLKAIKDRCEARGIGFDLLNLAEDGRIEELARQRRARDFGWLELEEPCKDATPAGLLLQIVQSEGRIATVRERFIGQPDVLEKYDRIAGYYYPRFVASLSTWGLIPTLQEWVIEFGSGKCDGTADLSIGSAITSSGKALTELMAASEEIGSKSTDRKLRPAGPVAGTQNVAITREGNHTFSSHGALTKIEPAKVDALTNILRAAFRSGRSRISTHLPSRRLNLKGIARGSEKVYRREVISEAGRCPRVRYYHDCSGSMRGEPCTNGLYLLAALNNLAAGGHIDAYATLTMGLSSIAARETFRLPVPVSVIESVPAVGHSECFHHAFNATRCLLDPGDLVLAYTDGEICDTKVDQLQWRKRAVFSVGLYVGTDKSEQLRQWFDSSLCRNSIEGLAIELAGILRERARRTA